MVSAARLGQKSSKKMAGRIKVVSGGLVTAHKSKLGAKMKSRLTAGKVEKVGNSKKAKFVLTKKFDNKAKVLIRTNLNKQKNGQIKKPVQGKQANVQQKNVVTKQTQPKKQIVTKNQQKPRQRINQQVRQQNPQFRQQNQFRPLNQKNQQMQQQQPKQQFQQQKFKNQIPQQQFKKQIRSQQIQNGQNPRYQQASKQQQRQFKPNQNQQNSGPLKQNNETKLALDIINILLEDKKKERQQPAPGPARRQRGQMNWNRQQPNTVYIQQQPVSRPVYVQQAPKTIYVDENGFKLSGAQRVVQQPVVVRRRAVQQGPVQYVQRGAVQRRLY